MLWAKKGNICTASLSIRPSGWRVASFAIAADEKLTIIIVIVMSDEFEEMLYALVVDAFLARGLLISGENTTFASL